ncbi:hypothetical protein T484DRAFT_1757807 [Baffinella frigidus]|nr:hypothetical protein T484DRAFT_1757807 [Cryptophyta sp. CCMP2293]
METIKFTDFFGKSPKTKTLLKSEDEITKYLTNNEKNDKGFELIDCYDQVKPYFDFDGEYDISDDLENIEFTKHTKNLKSIDNLLSGAQIVSLHRPIRKLLGEKMKISLRYFVTNMTIKSSDLKKVIEVYDARQDADGKTGFDTSVYNNNRMMNTINCIKPKREKDCEYPYKGLVPFHCDNYKWHDFYITYITNKMKKICICPSLLKKREVIKENDNDIIPFSLEQKKKNMLWLSDIVGNFNKKEAFDYDTWFSMMGCLVNCCKKLQLLQQDVYAIGHAFSVLGANYDDKATDKMINHFLDDTDNKNKYGFTYLKARLKISNLEYYDITFPEKDYKNMKIKFEKEMCMIKDPLCFIRTRFDGSITIMSKSNATDLYWDWICDKFEKNKKGKWEKKELHFIKLWMADPTKLSYEFFCMKPDFKTPDNVLNLFEGFGAQHIDEVDDSLVEELIKPILLHLKEVIFGEHVDWGLDWMANLVQNPLLKTMVAIFIQGKEGDGKDIIFDFFRSSVIGNKYAYQTSCSDDLMGKFQSGSVNKVFVQWDEVDGSDIIGKNRTGLMKNLITGPFVKYEVKGVMQVDTPNILNLILTSNSLNPIYITPTDRRYCAFNSSSIYKGNSDYFSKLAKHLEKPEVARAFYQHLMKRDITKYDNWQIGRPITSYYKDLVTRNLHPIFSFLTHKCVYSGGDFLRDMEDIRESTCILNASILFTKFNALKMSRNIKSEMTATSFGLMIKKELNGCDGIIKTRNNTNMIYKLDYAVLQEFLIQKNFFDSDI